MSLFPNHAHTNEGDTPTDAAHAQISTYLKTLTARAAIEADIHHLSNTMISIEDNFSAIASQISVLDRKDIVSYKFAPEWKDLHKEYTTLKQESGSVAKEISSKIKALVKNVVPVLKEDISLDRKEGILAEYIEGLKPFQPAAQENDKTFPHLRQKVTVFKDSLKYKVESQKEGADERFKDIEERLKGLEEKLKKLSDKQKKGLGILKTIFGDNKVQIESIKALDDLAPTLSKEMMGIALRYHDSVLANELEEVMKELERDMEQLRKDLKHKPKEPREVTPTKVLSDLRYMYERDRVDIKDDFSQVLQDVADLEPTFKEMCDKINKIQGIWQFLLKDSHTLINIVSSMKSESRHKLVFDRFLGRLEETYEPVQSILEDYSLVVQPQHLR
jgi:predicted  nucleic acid-binding Zn-ribbon protein